MEENVPDPERAALRKKLVAARLALPDRLERAVELQQVLRVWLIGRPETRTMRTSFQSSSLVFSTMAHPCIVSWSLIAASDLVSAPVASGKTSR